MLCLGIYNLGPRLDDQVPSRTSHFPVAATTNYDRQLSYGHWELTKINKKQQQNKTKLGWEC